MTHGIQESGLGLHTTDAVQIAAASVLSKYVMLCP